MKMLPASGGSILLMVSQILQLLSPPLTPPMDKLPMALLKASKASWPHSVPLQANWALLSRPLAKTKSLLGSIWIEFGSMLPAK